eukprot:GEZU01042838.1.p1 GENE.GEZU01042838.1~~GEZU01042838.1.p1  ORF type:complete len:271 (+),score=39.90 GEZU01042838.1:85-813(+)
MIYYCKTCQQEYPEEHFVFDHRTCEYACPECGTVNDSQFLPISQADRQLEVLRNHAYKHIYHWHERLRFLYCNDTEVDIATMAALGQKCEAIPNGTALLDNPTMAKSVIQRAIKMLCLEGMQGVKRPMLEKWIQIRYVLTNKKPDFWGEDSFYDFMEKMDKFFIRTCVPILQLAPEGRRHIINLNFLLRHAVYNMYGEEALKKAAPYLPNLKNKKKRAVLQQWMQAVYKYIGLGDMPDVMLF